MLKYKVQSEVGASFIEPGTSAHSEHSSPLVNSKGSPREALYHKPSKNCQQEVFSLLGPLIPGKGGGTIPSGQPLFEREGCRV